MRDWRFEETGGSAGEGEYGEEGTHEMDFVERSNVRAGAGFISSSSSTLSHLLFHTLSFVSITLLLAK